MRRSCYNCKFSSTDRVGDITLGDAWGVEEFLPSFDTTHGVSLILVNNEKSKKIFDCVDEFKSAVDVTDKQYKNYQQNLRYPTKCQTDTKIFGEISEKDKNAIKGTD